MKNLSKKQYPSNQYLNGILSDTKFAEMVSIEAVRVMARELLAYREAAKKPVAYADPQSFDNFESMEGKNAACTKEWMWRDGAIGLVPLYTIPPLNTWISVKDDMPNPEDKRRVCAYTPSEHSDFEYRSVPASLFKVVCSAATHWCYFSPPSELTAPPLPVVPDERKEFEQFMEGRFRDSMDRRLCKNGDGYYMSWDMNVAWVVWQHRAKLQSASFRDNGNSSTKNFRETAETSTKCPKCGGRETYHCPQANGTVECECNLAAAPKPNSET